MKLRICEECQHGGELNGRSHCGKEAIFSELTNCIRAKAIAAFIQNNAVESQDTNQLELAGV